MKARVITSANVTVLREDLHWVHVPTEPGQEFPDFARDRMQT
jgi:hypothetical protein